VRDMTSPTSRDGDVVLGDDWVAPDATAPSEMRARRERRGLFSLRASPITRKIITFNLVALCLLIAGISYLNYSRDSLAVQRAAALVSEAELIADVIEAQLPTGAPVNLATGDGVDVAATLDGLDLRSGTEVFVFDASETLIANTLGTMASPSKAGDSRTILTDGLNWLWSAISTPFATNDAEVV
jgi:two-component system sensor histidine kinase ChvG